MEATLIVVRAIKISPKACDNSQPGAAHQSHVCSDSERPLESITLPARPPQTPPCTRWGRGRWGPGHPPAPSSGGELPPGPGAQPQCLSRTPRTCGWNEHGAQAGHGASRSCRCSHPSVLQAEATELGGCWQVAPAAPSPSAASSLPAQPTSRYSKVHIHFPSPHLSVNHEEKSLPSAHIRPPR